MRSTSGVGQHHPAGYRKGLDPGGDVHRIARELLGLDNHLAHMDADTNRDFLRS